VTMAVMVAGLVMGLVFAVGFLPRLIGPRRPRLILDDVGFDDRTSLLPAGRVSWSEVRELSILHIARADSIAIRVTDPERLYANRGWLARRLAGANRRWADVSITCQTLDASTSEVFKEMQRRWDAARAA